MIESELLHYGYLFVLLGTVFEGDATLLTAAFLAHRGHKDVYAVNTQALGRSSATPLLARLFSACPGGMPVAMPATGASYASPFDTLDGKQFLINCTVEPPRRFVASMNWPFAGKQ